MLPPSPPWPRRGGTIARARPLRPVLAVAVALLALGSLSNFAQARPAGSGPADTVVASSPAAALPLALSAPWAARAGFVPSEAVGAVGVHPFVSNLTVTLSLWARDLSLYDRAPGAPALSEAAFERTYSPSAASYAALESYLNGTGLRVLNAPPDRMSITVAGPAAAAERAFGAQLVTGSVGGRVVHFPTSVPELPAALAPLVASIGGLSDGFDQFTIPFHSLPLPPRGAVGPVPAQGRTSNLVTPASIHAIYGMDQLYNFSGQTHFAQGHGIAIVLWGDGFAPSDLTNFFSQYYPSGFPAPEIQPVPVAGAPAPSAAAVNDPSQAPLELTLDIEWSASQAPGAAIYAVYAPDGPASNQYSPSDAALEGALATAIDEPTVDVVSMSFATADGADTSFQAAFSSSFATALAKGITLVAASGDNGGTNNPKGACTSVPQPEFPAASPDVVAVGGTAPVLSLALTGGVTGLESEPAWSGSGGGFAVDYPAPSWQLQGSAAAAIGPHGGRGIPDVSAPASFNFLYFNGQEGAGNGTSFGAPLWAGLITEMDALHGTPFGQIAPRLYAIGAAEPAGHVAQGLVDITSGGNCLGGAGPGWDTATGWGSPRAGALYADLSGSYVAVSLVPATTSAPPGGTLVAHVTVENATTHQPIAGLSVNLSLDASGYTGPCGGTLSTASGTTDANGSLNGTLSIPSCFFGTRAVLSASVLDRGLFGENATEISVNLLGFGGVLALFSTFPYNLIAFALIMVAATVIGWSIGSYRRRRRIARYRAAQRAALARAPVAPAASPPAGPPAPPEAAGAAAVTIPAPPGPGPAEVTCPVCQHRFVPELDFCPRCGHYLTGPAPPAGGTPPG
jgi:hypothetical protein